MNTIAKKILLVGFALLLSACAHHPQQHSYYPDNRGYSSGYTVVHRNYYGKRPDHYQRGHDRAYSPRHDRHNTIPRRGNNYQKHQQQRDRSNDRHDDNNADRRNHH